MAGATLPTTGGGAAALVRLRCASLVGGCMTATSGSWTLSSYGGMQYELLLPDGYTPQQTYPVLLFLQGGGQENEERQNWKHPPAGGKDNH